MADVEPYLEELARRLSAVLGEELVGVYAGGSYALGDYEPGRSDLDVAVVVREQLPPAVLDGVVAAVRHEALPCPARGLELVVYPLALARSGSTEAGFLLNLNTGAGMSFRVEIDPSTDERHWFPLDRSILARHGRALLGPPPAHVFAEPPRDLLLQLLLEALEWHGGGAARSDDVVLNAVRTLRFAAEGTWSGKGEAGRWALAAAAADPVVAQALAARAGGEPVAAASADSFRRRTLERVRGLQAR